MANLKWSGFLLAPSKLKIGLLEFWVRCGAEMKRFFKKLHRWFSPQEKVLVIFKDGDMCRFQVQQYARNDEGLIFISGRAIDYYSNET